MSKDLQRGKELVPTDEMAFSQYNRNSLNTLLRNELYKHSREHIDLDEEFDRRLNPFKTARILETAAGSGAWAKRMIQRGHKGQLDITDFHPILLEIDLSLMQHKNLRFIEGVDARNPEIDGQPIEDKSYDYYVMKWGPYHIDGADKAFFHAYRVLGNWGIAGIASRGLRNLEPLFAYQPAIEYELQEMTRRGDTGINPETKAQFDYYGIHGPPSWYNNFPLSRVKGALAEAGFRFVGRPLHQITLQEGEELSPNEEGVDDVLCFRADEWEVVKGGFHSLQLSYFKILDDERHVFTPPSIEDLNKALERAVKPDFDRATAGDGVFEIPVDQEIVIAQKIPEELHDAPEDVVAAANPHLGLLKAAYQARR